MIFTEYDAESPAMGGARWDMIAFGKALGAIDRGLREMAAYEARRGEIRVTAQYMGYNRPEFTPDTVREMG